MPLPVDDLRQILADFMDVVLMSNQLVVHLLDQISALVAQLRQVLQDILNQVEAVDLVLHAHIERRGDGAFLLVAMDRQVAVGTLVGQLMDQGRVTMECEDDRLILAMTTSGSSPASLEAQSQMPTPWVQCLTACSMVSHWGRGCLEVTSTLT